MIKEDASTIPAIELDVTKSASGDVHDASPKRLRLQWRSKRMLWGLAIVIVIVVMSVVLVVAVVSARPKNKDIDSSSNSNNDNNSNNDDNNSPLAGEEEPTSTSAIPLPVPSNLLSPIPSNLPTYVPSNLPTLTPPPSPLPTTTPLPPTHIPGNLTTFQVGLLLSDGLNARIVAQTGHPVIYRDGSNSTTLFHGKPDGGATFPDTRPNNPGGFIYVSNSELQNAQGGVDALTFDRYGNVLNYEMVLTNSTMNCGGGRTPWNTWMSCEEEESTGLIYQVDPTGARAPQVATLGNAGGRWESFSHDVRNRQRPYFFATEDHNKGTVRRFTPATIDWDNNPWNMLHGAGATDYLMIFPNSTNDGGTFQWTNDLNAAKNNARSYYPQTEGIDVYGSQMFLVCKNIRQLFTINIDDGTYSNRTTISGLFDGKPDTLQRILGDSRNLLYFTEEGGVDAGVYARDHLGRFYTILESPVYKDETSGLSFSADGRFLIVAYQDNDLLFQVWHSDGLPFHDTPLDVKYHRAED